MEILVSNMAEAIIERIRAERIAILAIALGLLLLNDVLLLLAVRSFLR